MVLNLNVLTYIFLLIFFYKVAYQICKASIFFYEILRLFTSQNIRNTSIFSFTKACETIENICIYYSFNRFCLLVAIVTIRLLILEILFGDENCNNFLTVSILRSNHWRYSVKKDALKNFAYFTCFPVKFAKFLRITILKNICE